VREPVEDELDACMARLALGEREAFDPLFRALYPRAMRLMRLELSADQAADAAQSALVSVFARAGEFHAGKPVLPWFYAILANELRSYRRRGSTTLRRDADVRLAAELPAPDDPERALVERELYDALARAIAALDDDAAGAISTILHGSERPQVTATAFRKRVSRAYARLRWLLGAFDGK
jgi:RNA polymerase sigma-70 factor (ECF subfamily)